MSLIITRKVSVTGITNTTPSTGVGTGALQVAGGIYAGAASVFGGAVTTGGALAITASGQAGAKATITNTDAASYSHLDLSSSSGQNSALYQFGSTYATAGRYVQGSMMLEAGGSGGLNLATSAATPIRFYTNGDNVRLAIASDGAATFAGTTLTLAPSAAEAIITSKGRATGTNPLATTSRGGSLVLANLDTTDNNAEAVSFHNSNDLAVASIVAQNVSHTGRTGKLYFNVSNGAAPVEAFSIAPTGAATFAGAVSVSGTSATWTSGTGSPESVKTAPVGSLYTRTDGGAGTTLYVKESGSGNTGWVAK